MGILEDFANGNINPNERSFERDSEYGKAVKLVTENEEKLLEKLNEEEKELYQAYFKVQSRLDCMENASKFVQGYRLGALMMLEVLTGAKVAYCDEG